jgi:hypothetical protein
MLPHRVVLLSYSIYSAESIAAARHEYSAACDFDEQAAPGGAQLSIRVRESAPRQSIDEFLTFALRHSLSAKCAGQSPFR